MTEAQQQTPEPPIKVNIKVDTVEPVVERIASALDQIADNLGYMGVTLSMIEEKAAGIDLFCWDEPSADDSPESAAASLTEPVATGTGENMLNMKNIKKLRLNLGWSQAELSRQTRMGHTDICRIESGRLIPYDAQLKKLAAALGVDEADRATLMMESN